MLFPGFVLVALGSSELDGCLHRAKERGMRCRTLLSDFGNSSMCMCAAFLNRVDAKDHHHKIALLDLVTNTTEFKDH